MKYTSTVLFEMFVISMHYFYKDSKNIIKEKEGRKGGREGKKEEHVLPS